MINSLVVIFKNKISYREIPLFRGAIINAVGENVSELFHNHNGEGFNYQYPMIQYKRIQGKAAIVCVDKGVEEIEAFFNAKNYCLNIGKNREEIFEIQSINPYRTLVQVWDEDFRYYLRDWLPLNSENHKRYFGTESLLERIRILEHILVGNILSACKGLGITIDEEICCCISTIEAPRKILYKGMSMMSFSCGFSTNISLPDYIGLGKGASKGHGVIKMDRY